MKKIGKITLSRKYDVLSENEMKLVFGGSGSGSGSAEDEVIEIDCIGKIGYTCYEGPGNEMTKTKLCIAAGYDAKTVYCSMDGRSPDCMRIAVCN